MSNIEDELSFKKWCQLNGINMFLFDGDDTVWGMVEIFRKRMNGCCDYLAEACPTVSRQEWENDLKRINNDYFEKVGVVLTRWSLVVAQLAKERRLPPTVAGNALEILMQIYTTPPQFKDGAEEGLAFLKKVGIEFGIVTHADSDWTRQKYRWLELERFLSWDNVYCVDPHGHKTAESWAKAIAYFGRTPRQCAIVGDSPRSDINPTGEIGVMHRFCIDLPNRWLLHEQEMDGGVWKIISINDLRGLGHQLIMSN